MNPHLILLAAALGLGVVHKDGKYTRKDREISEDELVAAITDAIRSLQQAAEDQEPGEGEMGPDEMKAKIAELEGELATLKAEKDERDAADAEEEEEADRADANKLADALNISRADWVKDMSAADRRLAIVKAKGLVDADTVLRSDAAPDGMDPAFLGGMVKALRTSARVDSKRDSKPDPLTIPSEPHKRDDADTKIDAPDQYKAALDKRRKDRRAARTATA